VHPEKFLRIGPALISELTQAMMIPLHRIKKLGKLYFSITEFTARICALKKQDEYGGLTEFRLFD